MQKTNNSKPTWAYNSNYPGIDNLINKAKSRVPRFAFEYLDGGCNEDVNLHKNTDDLRKVELLPFYLASMQDHHLLLNCLVILMMHPLVFLPLDCRA